MALPDPDQITVVGLRVGMAAWIARWPLVDASVLSWAPQLAHEDLLGSPHRRIARDPRFLAAVKPSILYTPAEIAGAMVKYPLRLWGEARERLECIEIGSWASVLIDPISCCAAAGRFDPSAKFIDLIPAFPLPDCDRLNCMCLITADPVATPWP